MGAVVAVDGAVVADPGVGAVVGSVGAVVFGAREGDVADGSGLASVLAEPDVVGVGTSDGVGVLEPVGVDAGDEDEPPMLLSVVPDSPAFAIG